MEGKNECDAIEAVSAAGVPLGPSNAFPCLVSALIAGWRIGEPGHMKMRRVCDPSGEAVFYGRTRLGILRTINKKQRELDRYARNRAKQCTA